MLPLLSRDAVRALDAEVVARLGLPSIMLMENAGRGAFDAIVARFGDRTERPVIVGGTGQNGGDAWVVARHLCGLGVRPSCWLIGADRDVRGDARTNLDALRKLGVVVTEVAADTAALTAALEQATLVVDGLFGTGLTRPIDGAHARVVEQINGVHVPVVALDLPSGIDADTGAILGCAVKATLTVTFAARKPGLYQYPGAEHAGEVACASIGAPAAGDGSSGVIELADVARALPPRPRAAHKGVAGHVLIVAGAPGTSGAALLSALGALRMGAGLVTVYTRAGERAIMQQHPEIMVRALPSDVAQATQEVLRFAQDKRAAVVGPGLGLDPAGQALCLALAAELPIPTLLDADALTAIGTEHDRVGVRRGPRVLTPHPGEASRLSGLPTSALQADRLANARELAAASGAVVALKGAATVIAASDGRTRICDRGTPALAVAGTGDVLSGAIGALLAQLDPFDAAWAGVCLHALAGELATPHDRGLLASEVAAALPRALDACRD